MYLLQENLAKKKGLIKQNKMPELAESSETEKGCGSSLKHAVAEMNGKDQGLAYAGSASQTFQAFPSLPDETLIKLGVHRVKGEHCNR